MFISIQCDKLISLKLLTKFVKYFKQKKKYIFYIVNTSPVKSTNYFIFNRLHIMINKKVKNLQDFCTQNIIINYKVEVLKKEMNPMLLCRIHLTILVTLMLVRLILFLNFIVRKITEIIN